MSVLGLVPRWLIWLIVVAVVIFIANTLGFIHIHGGIEGSVHL